MMKRFLTFFLLLATCFCAMAQTITFSGSGNNNHPVKLDRVVITNHAKDWQKTLYWPDTTWNFEFAENGGLQLSQNNPNPFTATTEVMLMMAEAGSVTLEITDMNGYVVGTNNYLTLQQGTHQFRVTLAKTGLYLLTAHQNGYATSVKMMCNGAGGTNRIEYQGTVETCHGASLQKGDQMEYVGYATLNGVEVESRCVVQTIGTSKRVALPFVGLYEQGGEGSPIDNTQGIVKGGAKAGEDSSDFRVALSLSPFSLNQFEQGYKFVVGDRTATSPAELQQIYRDLGSTEMYVRIGTKRHKTAENTVDGKPDENANVHTFDQAIQLCQIAAELDIPINPEIMCAYTYMDMMESQGPRFEEYPEIYALQNGKAWSELSLDEICTVLEAYGAFVAESILNTGCTVNNWNLGNEANFCFAGIGIKAETAVNPRLAKASNLKRYLAPTFSVWWLKKHVWQYNAPAYAAVKRGVLSAYEKLGIDASNVKFSTHIATVVFPTKCSVKYFNYMKEKGYAMDVAGISYYPSAPSMSANRKKLLTKTVSKINEKCGLEVFIGEFSYPSGKMEGPFAGWNKKLKGYNKDQQGQANLYSDVIAWGKLHGLAGVRYWAPDYEGWYAMSMFEFANKKGTAKIILKNHKDLIGD